MKLVVTFDDDGNIVALAPVLPPPPGGRPREQRPLERQTTSELEVPKEFEGLPLLELHNRLRIDTEAPEPKLVTKA